MIEIYPKSEKRKMALLLFVYRLSLDFMYLCIIRSEYSRISLLSLGYDRGAFSFATDDPTRIIVSFVLSIIFIHFITSKLVRNDEPHEMICLGLLMMSILPNHVMFAYSKIDWRFIWLFSLFWGWMYWIIYTTTKRRGYFNRRKKIIGFSKQSARYVFWIVAAVFILASLVLSYSYFGGFHIDLRFDNESVYTNRLAARGAFGTLTNYFRNNTMFAVLPLLLIAFMEKKKPLYFAICLLVLAFLYSIDSLKIVLLLPFASIAAALLIKKKVNKTIIQGLLSMNISVILLYELTRKLTLVEYLVKRILFIPAIIGRCYYEYVGMHGNQVFFSSLLQRIGIISEYAYSEIPLPFLIGRAYFGSVTISANTGGFAGAYAYGWFGMFFIPVFYALMFRCLDNIALEMDSKYYISFVILSTYMVVNASITSFLVVYGYILGLFLLSIMASTDVFRRKKV